MSNQTIIEKSDKGWIIEFPDEFAESVGIEKESIGLLEYKNDKIEVQGCNEHALCASVDLNPVRFGSVHFFLHKQKIMKILLFFLFSRR